VRISDGAEAQFLNIEEAVLMAGGLAGYSYSHIKSLANRFLFAADSTIESLLLTATSNQII
jgi:hypothetical protein